MDLISVFQRAVDQTGHIVANVKPDQLLASTPCDEWDVRALLNHTINLVEIFDTAARGGDFDPPISARDNVGDNPGANYRARAARLRQALVAPGLLEATWNMPFGSVPGMMAVGVATMEIAQHGWDIARSTGQEPDFDPEVTEAAFATARMRPAEQMRLRGVYGPEADCPAGAPQCDHLAAFLGRRVE
jgi:uncharacterized protein (TIGR03086 family)